MLRDLTFVTAPSLAAALLFAAAAAWAAEAPPPGTLEELRKRNATLEELVRQQQALIESLNRRVTALEQAGAKPPGAAEQKAGESQTPSPTTPEAPPSLPKPTEGFHLGNVHVSGEGGLAFFHSGSKGIAPHSEF